MKNNIKKGKIVLTITIAIACFSLAFIMTMQFKIVNQTDITAIENMREAELRTELANWKAKYEEIESKYQETYNMIEEYQKTKESNEETSQLVDEELQQINMILGKTDVVGNGIEIVLRETKNLETGQINANDLLAIVNALKLAGAEAISINDERIINMTDIFTINNTFVRINGQRILAPYIIKAIGNQTYLESELIGNGGYIDELRKLGHDVSIEKVNNLQILKYNDELKIKYME